MAAKTSLPLCGRSGVAGTRTPEEPSTGVPEELGTRISEELGNGTIEELDVGALEELVPDNRLLQINQEQSQNKGGFQQQEDEKRTHRCVIRGTSSTSSSSLSTKATIAPAKNGQKYSAKDKNKQQKDRAY